MSIIYIIQKLPLATVQGNLDTCQADTGDTPAGDINNFYILKRIVTISVRVYE